MVEAVEAQRAAIEAGIDRATLQELMPPGGARNAVACALWELEARRSGKPVWELAGLDPPEPLVTTFTLGADSPTVMVEGARRYAEARALQLKLTGDFALDIARVQAVCDSRPDAWIGDPGGVRRGGRRDWHGDARGHPGTDGRDRARGGIRQPVSRAPVQVRVVIVAGFSTPAPMHGWVIGGMTYATYNVVGAIVNLPVLRHLTSNRDAVVAGSSPAH